jgi:hypothetical protein
MLPMLDAWTNVFRSPGTRTTGNGPQKYAITGPGWAGGELPPGVTEIKAPTNLVWIVGRIHTDGTPDDLAEVRALEDRLALVPLGALGRSYAPPEGEVDSSIDMKTAVRNLVDALDPVTFFDILAETMKANPPAAADAPMVARLARLGIVAGKPFDATALSAAASTALDDVPKAAQAKIKAHADDAGTQTAAQEHGTGRAESGFSVEELVAEFRALRASVILLWTEEQVTVGADEIEELIRFNEAIDQALSETITFFSEQVNRARNLLLGMLGHDMRNPLNAIQMTASNLATLNAGTEVSEAASRLIRSGASMKALLDDLVDFNRTKLGLGINIALADHGRLG